ncbi:hypothetical protein B0I35DRAFT_364025 [Stachybotrys elegans]|uniref:SMP-30/Gluconolactonase/LRE-like region domain-containing protein n=1 Tax=Stachybotrys elegans TaxID=80388 RepID=A0A8K0SHB3_9HYPO|nr:hypothetical protein B0I35DRAFT_364025 [Stachybotrys elegans]
MNVALLSGALSLASGAVLSASTKLPEQAQLLLPEATVVLPSVPPPEVANGIPVFVPPGTSLQSLTDKPFHVFHEEFIAIIGESPTLTLIADSGTNPMFHEAVVWHPPTEEVFFAQNAGAKAAGTGLHRSSVIQKVSLSEAMAVSHLRNGVGKVQVQVVDFQPAVINPNGGTNYKGNFIFAGEGMGSDIAPALYLANPEPPYNTTILINNYYGRQFNSVNDVAVNPWNGDIYFTDVTYGYLQDFRPKPVLPNQVYKLNAVTKAVTAVADEFVNCNGITFSPDGRYAYVTDTGSAQGFYGYEPTKPSSIYRYTVAADGTFENRKLFAHVTSRVPDGVHCDTNGNVYAGCGDGVHVWNPSGVLLGKIFTGETAANFQFAGDGRMVICGETHLYFATLAAKGAALT